MRGKERLKMGCIMTPMPNYLSTLKPHHNRVEHTLQNNINHTTKCGKGKKECGSHTRDGEERRKEGWRREERCRWGRNEGVGRRVEG